MPQAAPSTVQASQAAHAGGAASADSAARQTSAVHSGAQHSLMQSAAALISGGQGRAPLMPLPAPARHLLGARGWPAVTGAAGLLITAPPAGPDRRRQLWGQPGVLLICSSSPATHRGAWAAGADVMSLVPAPHSAAMAG